LHTSVPRYLKGDLTIEENQETSRCFPKGLSPNGRLPHPPSLSYAAGPLGAAAAGLPHLVSGRPCGDAGGDPDPRRGTGGPQHTLSDVTYLPPGSFDRPPPRGRTGGSPTPRGPGPLPGRDVAGGGPCGRPLLLPAPHRPPAHRRRHGPGPRAPGTCVRCATVTLHHRRGGDTGVREGTWVPRTPPNPPLSFPPTWAIGGGFHGMRLMGPTAALNRWPSRSRHRFVSASGPLTRKAALPLGHQNFEIAVFFDPLLGSTGTHPPERGGGRLRPTGSVGVHPIPPGA